MKKTLTTLSALALIGLPCVAWAMQPTATPSRDGGTFTAPGEKKDEFPGPRGTKISFPTGLYDEKADAHEQIRKAREIAARENKRVLVMWGENKCGFCVFLNDVLSNDPLVKPMVKAEYVWIKCDIGKFDKNINLAEYYDTKLLDPGFGAPALTVIDPDTDKAIDRRGGNQMTAKPMTMERVFDEKGIYEFLANAKAPAKPAGPQLISAQAAAAKGGKKVLAFFTMPLNEGCDVANAWLGRADVQGALGKGFVVAKIDTERMIGGQDVLMRVAGTKAVMAPYIALLDGDGNAVTEAGKFTALPKTDDQIAGFIDALRKAHPGLTDAEKDVIVKSLKEAWEPKPEEKK